MSDERIHLSEDLDSIRRIIRSHSSEIVVLCNGIPKSLYDGWTPEYTFDKLSPEEFNLLNNYLISSNLFFEKRAV